MFLSFNFATIPKFNFFFLFLFNLPTYLLHLSWGFLGMRTERPRTGEGRHASSALKTLHTSNYLLIPFVAINNGHPLHICMLPFFDLRHDSRIFFPTYQHIFFIFLEVFWGCILSDPRREQDAPSHTFWNSDHISTQTKTWKENQIRLINLMLCQKNTGSNVLVHKHTNWLMNIEIVCPYWWHDREISFINQ